MLVKQDLDVKTNSGKNFTAIHLGPLVQLDKYELFMPSVNRIVKGKVFVREAVNATGMQISINKLPSGVAVPFFHAHKHNEEIYVFVGGKGQMQIDEQTFAIEEGSIVRIAGEGMRTWRNNSEQDLYFIVIQAKENSLTQDTFDDGIKSEKAVSWEP